MIVQRLKKTLRLVQKKNWDALLISSQANVTYLSGFTGEGILFLTPKEAHLIVDGRYALRAKHEVKQIRVEEIRHSNNVFKKIKQLLKNYRVKRLGVEANIISYSFFKKIKALSNLSLGTSEYLIEKLRVVKDTAELAVLKLAAEITSSAFERVFKIIKPGMRENELVAEIEYFFRTKGAKSSFEPIVASGPRTIFPHPLFSCEKILPNTLVLIDLGAQYQGYNCDLTRVIFLGKISAKIKRIYKITLEAQRRAIAAIKPGVKISQIDQIARQYIKSKEAGKFFKHALGHGVGREIHELPRISSESKGVIRENMVFAVEPGIYLPGYAGVRIEDTVLVTKNGARVLTPLAKHFAK